MRVDGELAVQHSMNSKNFFFGYGSQPVPPLAENAHQASCLTYFEINRAVHQTMQEEIAWKHGDRDAMLDPSALGPHLHRGQKELKALRRELLVYQLLTVTPGVQCIPRTSGSYRCWQTGAWLGALLYIHPLDDWQGFAPFGLCSYPGARPLNPRVRGMMPVTPHQQRCILPLHDAG